MEAEGVFYTPTAAAETLGIGRSTLRRWGALYERVVAPLPRDVRGGRLWTEEALTLVAEAKRLSEESRIPMEVALKRAAEGAGRTSRQLRTKSATPVLDALNELSRRLAVLEEELRALRQENADLKALLKVLEPPRRRRPWWRFWG